MDWENVRHHAINARSVSTQSVSSQTFLPHHPLLRSAIDARMLQDSKLVLQLCRHYEEVMPGGMVDSWDWAHLQMLKASSLSLDLIPEQRLEIYQSLRELSWTHPLKESFLYLYELSGVFIRLRKYSMALEYSLAAESRSFDANSTHSSRLNTLIIQEALGFDIANELVKFERALMDLRKSALNPKTISEFYGLQLRFLFREGRTDQIINYQGPPLLYLEWLRRLPQLGLKTKPIQFVRSQTQSYSQFIENTLLFRLAPDELQSPPVNHWTDRLYLWTWTALTRPEIISMRTILQLLEGFQFENAIELFTAEDRMMLGHCLTLISLYDPPTQKKLSFFIQRLGPKNYDAHPFLAEEKRVIDSLVWLTNDGTNEYKRPSAISVPLFAQLTPITKTKLKKLLPGLEASLEITQPNDYTKVIVDLAHARVWDPIQGIWILSEGLAQGLSFFSKRSHLDAAMIVDFMEEVFGIPNYDATIHYRKVYNLLFRMKTLNLCSFQFSLRGSVINFSLKSNPICPFSIDTQKAFDRTVWRKLLARVSKEDHLNETKDPLLSNLLIQFQLHQTLSRSYLQKISGSSKAKVVRTLNKMIQLGTIKRVNSGRNSQYMLENVT